MPDNPMCFKIFFQVSVVTFNYICDIIRLHMERKPPSRLTTIVRI